MTNCWRECPVEIQKYDRAPRSYLLPYLCDVLERIFH